MRSLNCAHDNGLIQADPNRSPPSSSSSKFFEAVDQHIAQKEFHDGGARKRDR
jgi:hypothetical protein